MANGNNQKIRKLNTAKQQYPAQPQQIYPQQQAAPSALPAIPEKPPFHFLDKRMIIPLVVIIFLILVAIVVVYLSKAEPEEEISEEVVTFPEVEIVSEEVIEEVPVSEFDIVSEECTDIDTSEGYAKRDSCFFDLAKRYKRVMFCNNIIQPSGPVSVDACYEYTAIARYNKEYCYLMSEFKGDNSFHSCMIGVAKVTDDPSLCLTLSVETGKYSKTGCIRQFGLTEEEFLKTYSPEE